MSGELITASQLQVFDILSTMPPEDDLSSLARARERLYAQSPDLATPARAPTRGFRSFPHAWKEALVPPTLTGGRRHVRLATLFFGATLVFFVISLAVAGYFFYFGGNSVSVDKVTISIQGPTTISGGDIVPLSISVTNKNPVAINNATIEIAFPLGTRDATNLLIPYPRYIENLGTIESGETVTRSVKAAIFGAPGQTISLPASFSYSATGSKAVFGKKDSYAFLISSTPLSVSVDTVTETVAGQPLTLTVAVRSNASVPLDNVVLASVFPFGFNMTSSSIPATGGNFYVGELAPGTSKNIKITGVLEGQQSEDRTFHFTVGTAQSESDQTLAVTYMTQDVSVHITAPFIATTLSVNGESSSSAVVSPGGTESVTVNYVNTLPVTVNNATISIALSGSAIDYSSVRTSSGFYRSTDHTIVFSRDTDPALASLAPGASGVGSFTFSTLPAGASGAIPTLSFSLSVSGTRVGQTNVPEKVTASETKTVKVVTSVVLTALARHTSGALATSGPIPPRVGQPTSYAIEWGLRNSGSAVADGTVSTILPSYVTYENKTAGSGSFSYDPGSRTVSWNVGDVPSRASVSGSFLITLVPSSSQVGAGPSLTATTNFSGYDRFAGVRVSAAAGAVTTETTADPGYVSGNGTVQ